MLLAAGVTSALAATPASLESASQSARLNYREYFRSLPDALRDMAAKALQQREIELARAKTPAAIAARQRWVRDTFWSLIGGKRERPAVQIRSRSQIERERYVIEKIVYSGRPGEWISANVYVPKTGSAKFPGVLFQAGHTKNGKAGYTYQCCCQALAQLGFVVLIFDPIGQGERTNYPGPDGLTRFPAADDEHTVPGRQLLLAGETMTRLQLEDALTSLDVLSQHPSVDASRIGVAGQSGGGTLTMMVAAVDERVAAAVVSCGNTENIACRDFQPPGSIDDAEQNFVDSGPNGFDRWDLLWPFAPRPLLMLTSAMDFFDVYSPNYIRNSRQEYARLSRVYQTLDRSDRIGCCESPLPHGLAFLLRLELYRWFTKWLLGSDHRIESEPSVAPEDDRVLWATASGSVTRAYGSKTAFDLVRAGASAITTPAAAVLDLRPLLRIASHGTRSELHVLSTAASRRCSITAAEVQSAPGVWVPMWIFAPQHGAKKMIMLLDPLGRNQHCQESDFCHELAEQVMVCVPDLRGFGDLQPEYSPGNPAYARSHQQDDAYAWASMVLGCSLLGQRVEDLLAVLGALHLQFRNADSALLAAQGALTIPALCAAALDPRISALYLSDHLVSWRSITEHEEYSAQFSNFLFGILRHTDLPQIASSLAPRPVTLANCVDGRGAVLAEDKLRDVYRGPHMRFSTAKQWDAGTLLSLL